MFDSVGEIIGLTVLGLFVLVIILIYFCKCYSDYTVGRFRDKQTGNKPVSNEFDKALLGASERNTSVDGAVGIHDDPFIDTAPVTGDHNDFSLVVESYARNSQRKLQHKAPVVVPAAAAELQRQYSETVAPEATFMPLASLAQNEPPLNSKSIEVEVQVHNKDQYPSTYKAQSSVPFSPPTNPAPPPFAKLRKEQHTEDPRRAFRNQSETSASDPMDRHYPADVPIQRGTSQNGPEPIAPPKEIYKPPAPEPQFIPPQPVAKPPAPPRSEYMNLGVAKPLPPDYMNLAKKKPAPPTPPVAKKPEVPEVPARYEPPVPARVMSPAIKDKFNGQLSEALMQREAAAIEPPSTKTPRTPKKSRKVPDHLVSEAKPKTPKTAKKSRKVPEDSFGLVTSPSQMKARKSKPKNLPQSEENTKPLDNITNGQNTPTKQSYKTNINYASNDQNGDFIDSLCSPKSQHKPFVYNPDKAEFDYMLSPKLRRNDNAKNSDI